MTEQELADLRLAAKAAGVRIIRIQKNGWIHADTGTSITSNWTPRDDDGDSLRLAARLGMTLEINRETGDATAERGDIVCVEWGGMDPAEMLAATRRAVFGVAVKVGKAMEGTQ